MKRNTPKYIVLINLILVAIIIGAYFAFITPYSVAVTKRGSMPIYKGTAKGCVALQCTVEWNASRLEAILDTLKKHGVFITFMVSGEWANENPGMLQRMYSEGHEIGIMGYSPNEDGRLEFVKKDLQRAKDAVFRTIGMEPELYYCGMRNTTVSAKAARALSLSPVMCTIDLICSNGTADDILARAKGNTNGADIVLVSPTAAFSDALEKLLVYYSSIGLTVATTGSTIYN